MVVKSEIHDRSRLSTRSQALPGNADPEALPPITRITRSQALPGNADPEALPPITRLLVPRLCLVTQIRRLCLQFYQRNKALFPSKPSEAEPLEIDSQAEPGNQFKSQSLITSKIKNKK